MRVETFKPETHQQLMSGKSGGQFKLIYLQLTSSMKVKAVVIARKVNLKIQRLKDSLGYLILKVAKGRELCICVFRDLHKIQDFKIRRDL